MNISRRAIALIPSLFIGSTGIYFTYSLSGTEVQNKEDYTEHNAEPEVPNQVNPIEQVAPKHEIRTSNDSWKTESISKKFPGQPKFVIKIYEDLREKDPVQYRYYYSKPKQKEIGLVEGKERVEVMRDHTMMILGCNHQYGTGWILDYVLPNKEKGEKYPTTWFIASNAHVYNSVDFDKTNPYQQVLNDVTKDRRCNIGSGVTIAKEKVQHDSGDFDRTQWKVEKHAIYRHMSANSETTDVSKWENTNPTHDPELWRYSDNSPKLFYFPHQYLGTDENTWPNIKFRDNHYYVDFAVMEINFKTENMARLFTRNFYDKYDRDEGTHKNKSLNFFAQSIAEKYQDQHQLLENDVHTFGAGYTYNGISNKATSNYDEKNKKGAKFTYYNSVPKSSNEMMLGHVNFNSMYQGNHDGWVLDTWGGKGFHKRGYGYVFDENPLFNGASGTLWAEKNGDVLGVYSSYDCRYRSGNCVAIVEPLRNKQIVDHKGTILAPAYDLMEGVAGQQGSYKEQVKKYILKEGKQTALSKLRNWKAN